MQPCNAYECTCQVLQSQVNNIKVNHERDKHFLSALVLDHKLLIITLSPTALILMLLVIVTVFLIICRLKTEENKTRMRKKNKKSLLIYCFKLSIYTNYNNLQVFCLGAYVLSFYTTWNCSWSLMSSISARRAI